MTKSVVIIQKENIRYTFIQEEHGSTLTPWGYIGEIKQYYKIKREYLLCAGGSTVSFENTTREKGNELYKKLMADGFKRFRDISEVTWYATSENNTPYEEEWKIEGRYLIPIKSRVLAD